MADQGTSPAKREKEPLETAAAGDRPVGARGEKEATKERAEDEGYAVEGGEITEDENERVWRGSDIRVKRHGATRTAPERQENGKMSPIGLREDGKTGQITPRPSLDDGGGGGGGDGDGNVKAGDDDDDDESKLYTRTLGSSVSVLDEKDAVARNGGARFMGEDSIRGRLRAADPFLWMSRLHAGATAISTLIDTAKSTLQGLNDSSASATSGDSNSIASDRSVRDDPIDQSTRGDDDTGQEKQQEQKESEPEGLASAKAGVVTLPRRRGSARRGQEDVKAGGSGSSSGSRSGSGSGSGVMTDEEAGGTVGELSRATTEYSQAVERMVVTFGVIEEDPDENEGEEEGQGDKRSGKNVSRGETMSDTIA